jgi:hypothetical protein
VGHARYKLSMRIVAGILGIAGVAIVIWIVTVVPAFDPELRPTYVGEPLDYRGNKTLVVAVYTSWAPVWTVTEAELARIDPTEYDLALVNAERHPETLKRLGGEIMPRVVVIKNGEVVKTLFNMTSVAQLK